MMIETPLLTRDSDAPPAGTGDFYEVVNGRIVAPPLMGSSEVWIANALNRSLLLHFAGVGLPGRTAVELLFRISTAPNHQRRPDLAFISYERWPKDRPVPRTAAWKVVPDLTVEVVSPGDLAVEVLEKRLDYFRAGVRRVWELFPAQGYAYLYESPTGVKVLDASGTLEDGDLLPSFRLRLADLFNETAGDGPSD